MLANTGQMWFYHAPLKRVDKPQQLVPAASQVPGLAALDPLDEEAFRREVGVKSQKQAKESDSKYIRLAKQGGRKNLLMFNAPKGISDEPQPYPRVDWFDHHESDPEKDRTILSHSTWQPPEYMVHEYEVPESENNMDAEETPKPKRAPFYTDNKSVWIREDDDKKPVRRSNRRNVTKLPEIKSRPVKSESLSFSKLIGGEYGNDWYRKQVGRGPMKTVYSEMNRDKGYLNMTEYQESICKKSLPAKKLKPIALTKKQVPNQTSSKNQDLFKLSKFTKVESKLRTDEAKAEAC